MKRDVVFSIIWCVLAYIILYLFRGFSVLINNLAENYLSPRILLNKIGVPLVGYIVLGLLIGLLALNIRYFSRVSKFITLGFAIYLILKWPLMMASDYFGYIYPMWMMLNLYETTTWFGGMIIALIIIDTWHEKLTILNRLIR